MASEENSTPLIQIILSLSTEIIKDSYQNLGGMMGELTNLKKRTVAAAIVRKWGEKICVMESDACVSQKRIVLWHLENWYDHSSNST